MEHVFTIPNISSEAYAVVIDSMDFLLTHFQSVSIYTSKHSLYISLNTNEGTTLDFYVKDDDSLVHAIFKNSDSYYCRLTITPETVLKLKDD